MDEATTSARRLQHALFEIGELALRRHQGRHTAQPKRAAASYLRTALTAARALARMSKWLPDSLSAAARLVERIIANARTAEEACFAAGGTSAPYLGLLVTAVREQFTLSGMQPPVVPAKPTIVFPKPPPLPTPAILRHGKHAKPGRHQTAFANVPRAGNGR